MTQRERQILDWIRENPLISQQELADKAGITRSSAAVHISNLMKKGYIAGRGYLLRDADYIVVIGGVNMDIGAVSGARLGARDSNPGRVTTSLGGVGRNIAHNLCLLGEQVAMVTVLGQDGFAQSVREQRLSILVWAAVPPTTVALACCRRWAPTLSMSAAAISPPVSRALNTWRVSI